MHTKHRTCSLSKHPRPGITDLITFLLFLGLETQNLSTLEDQGEPGSQQQDEDDEATRLQCFSHFFAVTSVHRHCAP